MNAHGQMILPLIPIFAGVQCEIFLKYMQKNDRYKKYGFENMKEVKKYMTDIMDMGNDKNLNPSHVILNLSHKLDLLRCCTANSKFSQRFDGYLANLATPNTNLEELKELGKKMLETHWRTY